MEIINKNEIKKKIILLYSKIKNKNHLIYLYVKSYLNSQRKGNSKTKERSEVKGSTRKITKQKGLGNARKGDIKNPIFKGGGRIFGPRKRDYKIKINKNIKKKVKKILIIDKILNNKIYIINKFKYLSYKTKKIILYFMSKNINIKNKNIKYLIITDNIYKNLLMSINNLNNILINYKKNINYFNVLKSDYIIFVGKKIEKYIINNILEISL
ncbi:MAG: 50S ribosomal protein L4 [Candidatus Shikimatogenerans bostrichidophilus]|nr:MAG: 50S ribosomal protein L4 [Candidatus Shikimatogenerans bostrichidophilus]